MLIIHPQVLLRQIVVKMTNSSFQISRLQLIRNPPLLTSEELLEQLQFCKRKKRYVQFGKFILIKPKSNITRNQSVDDKTKDSGSHKRLRNNSPQTDRLNVVKKQVKKLRVLVQEWQLNTYWQYSIILEINVQFNIFWQTFHIKEREQMKQGNKSNRQVGKNNKYKGNKKKQKLAIVNFVISYDIYNNINSFLDDLCDLQNYMGQDQHSATQSYCTINQYADHQQPNPQEQLHETSLQRMIQNQNEQITSTPFLEEMSILQFKQYKTSSLAILSKDSQFIDELIQQRAARSQLCMKQMEMLQQNRNEPTILQNQLLQGCSASNQKQSIIQGIFKLLPVQIQHNIFDSHSSQNYIEQENPPSQNQQIIYLQNQQIKNTPIIQFLQSDLEIWDPNLNVDNNIYDQIGSEQLTQCVGNTNWRCDDNKYCSSTVASPLESPTSASWKEAFVFMNENISDFSLSNQESPFY